MTPAAPIAGAGGGVARTLCVVVLALVAGDPRLDEGVDRDGDEQQAEHRSSGMRMLNDSVWPRKYELPARRHESQRAVGEADVPVGLRARRDRRRVVGSVVPDRVDREQRCDEHDHAEREEEEAAHLRHVDRHHRVAHDVAVRAARGRELRVLVDHHQHQVQHQQTDEDRGQQQDVQRVEATDDLVAGELAAEEQERRPGADERDALDHAVDDAEAVARQQVVGERVAGEALGHREDEEDEADDPVELARLAECTGEEDAQHVHADAGDEDERGPVVDLAYEQTAADVERQPQGRVERGRHLDAAHRQVGAGVVRRHHGRLEEERQERSREQDDDEAPQRDLAEHERPVVGEDLAPELLDEAREAGALVDVVRGRREESTAERPAVLAGRHRVQVLRDRRVQVVVLSGGS